MAKKFAGFTPEQMGKIIPEMQGMQADEQAAYLASQPGAAARVGKMAEVAQKRIGMAEGGLTVSLDDRLAAQKRGYASAGQQQIFNNSQRQNLEKMQQSLMQSPEYTAIQDYVSSTAPSLLDQNKLKSLTGVFESSSPYMEFENASKAYNNYVTPQRTGNQSPMTPVQPERQQLQLPDWAVGAAEEIKKQQAVPVQSQSVAPHSHTIGMHRGGYAEGGDAGTALNTAQQGVADANTKLQEAMAAQSADPTNEALVKAVTDAQAALNSAQQKVSAAASSFKSTEVPTSSEVTATAMKDPSILAKTAGVATVSETDKAAGEITTGTGQLTGDTPEATTTKADVATDVTTPTAKEAVTYEPLSVEATTKDVLDRLEAVTGKPSAEALVDAQTMSPEDLAQLGLSAAQLSEAQRVEAITPRSVQEGEMIEGSTVDMDRVKTETNFEAATGAPSSDATVQGQLTGLMEQFEGSEPPAWAAGAMRVAAAQMAARGLSASSMAGQAAIQAAMESAMPIAVQDAQTSASFEMQNLSNRQQAAMFAAEKRAEFLGLEFNQNFQSRVANAAKISEIANMNFTAEQQVALENARMAQSVDLNNLSAANAKVLADAAAMTQMDLTNLNNRQQAQVQNAKSFLDMDMANLANEQQTTIFKTQAMNNALLSDQAAENAAKQFNASSENQTNQFFANLSSQVSMFNNEQKNAMNQFNAGEANAVSQFNAAQKAAREQFNANNGLIVAQANAAWSQAITTAETAAINQANREAAVVENEFTMTAYNNIVQEERDTLSYAFSASESLSERNVRLQIAAIQAETSEAELQAKIDMAKGEGSGKLTSMIIDKGLDWAFEKWG